MGVDGGFGHVDESSSRQNHKWLLNHKEDSVPVSLLKSKMRKQPTVDEIRNQYEHIHLQDIARIKELEEEVANLKYENNQLTKEYSILHETKGFDEQQKLEYQIAALQRKINYYKSQVKDLFEEVDND